MFTPLCDYSLSSTVLKADGQTQPALSLCVTGLGNNRAAGKCNLEPIQLGQYSARNTVRKMNF